MRNKRKYEASAKIYFYAVVTLVGVVLATAIANIIALAYF